MTKVKSKGKAKTKFKKIKSVFKDPYTFDPFNEWIWREFYGSKPKDIVKFIEDHKDCYFFIGTDSQNYSKSKVSVFTTVLIAHRRDRGGSVIRYTDRRKLIPYQALSAKLTIETQRSIEVCKFLEEVLLEISTDEHDYSQHLVGISIDVSQNMCDKSASYKEMLVGLVVGHGYRAFVKPDAWAASSVADYKC